MNATDVSYWLRQVPAIRQKPAPLIKSEYEIKLEAAQEAMAEQFERAVFRMPVETYVGFAERGNRRATVREVMIESFDCGPGTYSKAMEIIQRIAQKGDADAVALVKLLAREFARANAEVE